MKILVTDGNQRATLAVTRSLGRAGMDIIVGETSVRSLSAASKYCKAGVQYPSPYTDEAGFLQAIVQVVQRHKIDMLVPITDITSAIFAEHKESLAAHTTVAVVGMDTFWRMSDKNSLHHLADELGIPTPTLFYLNQAQEIEQIIDQITFPCIVKPSRSRLRVAGRWIATSVQRATSHNDLRRLLREKPELQYPFMIQREVHGEGQAVFLMCEHGKPLVSFAHRRLREKPPWGGVSVLRESVQAEPRMQTYAERLLKEAAWHGVAMVEFKVDTQTGTPYLMEVNGRFWGSLQLAIDAGVDFPRMHVQLFNNETVVVPESYRTGIRSRWLLGDIDHLLLRLSKEGRARCAGMQGIGALLWSFSKIFQKNTYYEVESWDDPGPATHEILAYVRTGLNALLRH
jgi:predicted ATP-grasp superfamily ATP-dependent carboligase